jgi:hypothetical protein
MQREPERPDCERKDWQTRFIYDSFSERRAVTHLNESYELREVEFGESSGYLG